MEEGSLLRRSSVCVRENSGDCLVAASFLVALKQEPGISPGPLAHSSRTSSLLPGGGKLLCTHIQREQGHSGPCCRLGPTIGSRVRNRVCWENKQSRPKWGARRKAPGAGPESKGSRQLSNSGYRKLLLASIFQKQPARAEFPAGCH